MWHILRGLRSSFELTWESGNLVDPFFSHYDNTVPLTHTSVNTHQGLIHSILLWFLPLWTTFRHFSSFHTVSFWLTCSSPDSKAHRLGYDSFFTGHRPSPPLTQSTYSCPLGQKQITSRGISPAGRFSSAELPITFPCPAADWMRTFWCFSA